MDYFCNSSPKGGGGGDGGSGSSSSSNTSSTHNNNNDNSVGRRDPPPLSYEQLLLMLQNLWRSETEINGTVQEQEQRFQYMGSSSSSNPYMGPSSSSTNPYMGPSSSSSSNPYMGPSSSSSSNHLLPQDEFQRRYINNRPITRAQLMASLASINGGGTLMNSYNDNVGNNYLSTMNNYNSLDNLVPLNSVSRLPVMSSMNNNYNSLDHHGVAVNSSVSRLPVSSMNYQQQRSNGGFTLEDRISHLGGGYIDDQDLDLRNLTFKLIESKRWPVEKVLKICLDDPSLLDEIEPNDIVMVAELKLGSLYLQKILKDQDPLYFNKIFYATLDHMFRLMTNSEGTYVIRKLHSLCDLSQLKQIVEKINSRPDDLKHAAKNEAGADTLMKLIRVLKSTNPPLLHKYVLNSLTSECIDIMKSKPGGNLFKSCLKYLDPLQNQVLHRIVAAHCIDLATDDSGYFSLIALIENTSNPDKEELLLKIADHALYLSKDNKGNYVLQAILKLRIPKVDHVICANLHGQYAILSTDKCASNVVEKCIMSSGMEYPILELILSRKLHLLSQDSMGNYVVQKALDVTQQLECLDLYEGIVGQIRPHLKELQQHPIGRNVFRHINKRKVIMGKCVQCPIPM